MEKACQKLMSMHKTNPAGQFTDQGINQPTVQSVNQSTTQEAKQLADQSTIQGSSPTSQPYILMNHCDVVEAVGDWKHEPFSGDIDKDGYIWGRGTLDNKGSLFAMLQAADELIQDGYTPNRDIYFVSGNDEENQNKGAQAIAKYFEENGIKSRFTFDEGGMVTEDPVAFAKGNFAMMTTTIEFTMAKGSDSVNSVPQEAWVGANIRCVHHQNYDESYRILKEIADKYDLEIEEIRNRCESRVMEPGCDAFKLASEAVEATNPNVAACIPYLTIAATDVRELDKVSGECIRFSPLQVHIKELNTMHGRNEIVPILPICVVVKLSLFTTQINGYNALFVLKWLRRTNSCSLIRTNSLIQFH